MIKILFAFMVVMVAGQPNLCIAQSENPSTVMRKWIDKLETLESDGFKHELELVPTQHEQLKGLKKRASRIMLQGLMQKGSEEDKAKAMNQSIQELKSEVSKILLPHQITRLHQISLQRVAKLNRDSTHGLLSPFLIDQLEITDEQKTKVKDKSTEFNKRKKELVEKFLIEVERLQDKSRKSVLGLLDSSQRKKYEKLIGPPVKHADIWKNWNQKKEKYVEPPVPIQKKSSG